MKLNIIITSLLLIGVLLIVGCGTDPVITTPVDDPIVDPIINGDDSEPVDLGLYDETDTVDIGQVI